MQATSAVTHPCSDAAIAIVRAAPSALFGYLDDPRRLGAHMTQSSWMLAGGRMSYVLDPQGGRGAGARIQLAGRVLGLNLSVDEVVDTYEPPIRKAWHTVGEPRLLVIGHYRMGFDVRPAADQSVLRVFIEWEPIRRRPQGMFRLLGKRYAKWCVLSMSRDAERHFASHLA